MRFDRALALAFVCTTGCAREQASAAPSATPVRVTPAITRTVPVEIEAIGAAQPWATASVRARVSGQIVRVHFLEGADVREGQPLFTLDRRPFEVALRRARAEAERVRAARDNAIEQARRAEQLFAAGIATQQEAQTRRAEAAAGEAEVKAARAAVAEAELQLGYATVTAPITGRAGAVLLTEGNVVKADETPLVVINALEPMLVTFAVPERHLDAIRAHAAAGPLELFAAPPDADEVPSVGRVGFVDNAVDRATGTVRLRGTFDNQDHRLWPGQFVEVTVRLTSHERIVVPTAAVLAGQQGPYVLVVDEQSRAVVRPVVIERTADQETVVAEGLAPGEPVIAGGLARVVPGAEVRVTESPAQGETAP